MRGHIAKKGNKYYIVVRVPDERPGREGKERLKWFSGYSRRRDAENELPKILKQLVEGTYKELTDDTFGALMTSWLEDKKNSVRPGTWKAYRWLVETYLIPHLGKIKAVDLEARHLHNLYHNKLAHVLSAASIKKLHVIVVQALERSVTWGELPRNVAKGIELPKKERKTRNKFEVWTEEQLELFLEYAKDDPYYPIFELAASSGMRQSEILGLPRSELDLEKAKLSVVQAYVKADKGHDFDDPKSENSERSIALFPETVKILREHLQKQDEQRKLFEEKGLYKDSGLVFQTSIGTPINPRNLMRHYYKILKRIEDDLEKKRKNGEPVIEFKRIPFKDLRHTHATILLKNGWHPKVVQERLGHSSIQVTLDIYSHVIPDMQAALIGAFGTSITGRKKEPIKTL